MLDFEAPPIESSQMRRAGKGLLSLALMDARNHTLRWVNALDAAFERSELVAPLQAQIDPPLWTLGQLGWYQEYWISRNVQRRRGERCDATAPRLASIDPLADACYDAQQSPPGARWRAHLPDLPATRQYLVDTLEITLELLETSAEDDDALYFYRLALFHEDMQCEQFAELAQRLNLPMKLLPELGSVAAREPLLFPASRWRMGCEWGGFAFDNERGPHEHAVPEFEIDAQPVTWLQYTEFVEDGGYDDAGWWSEEGWAWASREQRRTPRYVDQLRHGVLQQRFGRLSRVPLNQPAVHVSWHEAVAWCRWAGRRLPTEVEWELAAHTGPSRGFQWGPVWEWTAGSFRPYPGFVAGPDGRYSEAAFGTHKVLRGASFATRERMRSAKFRRFLRPEQDAAFSGFRSCSI